LEETDQKQVIMRELDLTEMERIEGGACGGEATALVLSGIAMGAATGIFWGAVALASVGYGFWSYYKCRGY
jgi:hypothetical protein